MQRELYRPQQLPRELPRALDALQRATDRLWRGRGNLLRSSDKVWSCQEGGRGAEGTVEGSVETLATPGPAATEPEREQSHGWEGKAVTFQPGFKNRDVGRNDLVLF